MTQPSRLERQLPPLWRCPDCGAWQAFAGRCHNNAAHEADDRVTVASFDLTAVLKDHYLAGIECSHERGMDLPMCACSQVDLGWHPNVGAAVDAWVAHFMEAASS